jgi:hypothetical protein
MDCLNLVLVSSYFEGNLGISMVRNNLYHLPYNLTNAKP